MNNELTYKSTEQLLKDLEELQIQLNEANDTIEAIRTGQVDALVVHGQEGQQLYTLQTADQTYRVFIEKMTEGAVTIDRNGVILYCNSQFAVIVNKSLSQVIGSTFDSFVSKRYKNIFTELFHRSWETDSKAEVFLDTGEQQIPVQLSLTALDLQGGISLSIIVTDLTAQKEAQKMLLEKNIQLEAFNQALESSNHDLQQFASIASHDLQEPIRKIQIFSNLLGEDATAMSPQAQKYLQKIISSSARMRTLVVEILNYSKLSSENHFVECIDLNEIIDELREHFELIIEDKNAVIHSGKLPRIDANRGQIRQVFQNLISNALKFTKEGISPVIEVTSKRIKEKHFTSEEAEDGAYYLVTISDNGIGFNDKYVHNIFSLFERLNSKDEFEGAGIGLAIAKKIIEKHNGIITALSTEGNGAEFQIVLPASQSQINL